MNGDLNQIYPSFRKYAHFIVTTIAVSLASAIFEGFSIGMLIPFLQTFSEEGEAFRTGVAWIDLYVLGVEAPRVEQMYRICGIILFATWMRSVFGYLSGVFSMITRARILEDLRMRVVDQLQAVSLRFFSKSRGGELLNSIMNEISRTTASVAVLFAVIQQGTLMLIYTALMLWISWQLSVVVLVFFGLLSIGLTRLVAIVRERGEAVTRASGHFTSKISEFIDGARTVITYNMQQNERKTLKAAARGLADSYIASTKRRVMIQPLSQAVVSTVLILIVAIAVQFFIIPGKLEMAFLLTFLFALFRMMPTVHQLNEQRGRWAENRAGIANVAALLREDDKPYLPDGHREAPPLREAIAFQHVDFAYEPGTPVLQDINLRIERGKMTALVGASGAGKSTLVDLIPRLYDPTAGRVTMDGVDLRDFKVKSLRAHIAMVSQSTHIFNDSVRSNIAYGNPGADMAAIYAAAEQANALTFIDELEDGFDTVLGDRGVRLSGGQRQRLSIARAILRNPDILILDEATSDLDSISEKLVQQSLEHLMEDRTVVAIAHRLSTIENADWVVVLEEGRVVEQGPYRELIERKGQLWKYHAIQFQAA